MWRIQFANGDEAWIIDARWQASSDDRETYLNKDFLPRPSFDYDPNPLATAVKRAAKVLGGKIVEQPERVESERPPGVMGPIY